MTQNPIDIYTILLSTIGFLVVFLLKMAVNALKDMSISIHELNSKFAQMLERVGFHEKRLDEYGMRIYSLEIGERDTQ